MPLDASWTRLPFPGSLRRTARRLLHAPSFSAATMLCLALGIAVLAAMAALTDAFLLRPLPFEDPSRLVSVWKSFDDPGVRGLQYFLKPRDVLFLREEVEQLELAAIKTLEVDVTGDAEPIRVSGAWSTAELATILGLRPVRGRYFSVAEERTEAGVAVVSRSWWKDRWGGDDSVLGRTLRVEGRPYTVIGVLEDESSFPSDVDLWLPMRREDWEGRLGMSVVGRLAAGATVASARDEIVGLGGRLRELEPGSNATAGLDAEPLRESLTTDLRPSLLGLLFAATAFLLVALANSASLVVARAVRARPETATRLALGARRPALIRQAAAELGLLVGISALLGLALAEGALRTLLVHGSITTLSFAPPRIDARIAVAVAGLAAAATVALVAVYVATSSAGVPGANATELRSARAPRRRRLMAALVVADLAITAVLLLASGHVRATVDRMVRLDAGLRAEGLVTAGVSASPAWRGTHAQRVGFVDRVLEEARALPGVASAAAVHALPMTQPEFYFSFRLLDRPPEDVDARDTALFRVVAGDYFTTLGVEIVEGRGLRPTDVDGARRVVWANRAFVDRYWPDDTALGHRLVSARGGEALHVVGVVDDVRERGLAKPVEPALYWPMAQYDRSYLSRMWLVVRSERSAAALAADLRRRLREIDPEAVLFASRAMPEIVLAAVSRERFVRLLLDLFAGLAMVQAAAGVYGLTSYDVAGRTRELGLRFALGASSRRLIREVLRDALRRAALGFALGAATALTLNRALDAVWSVGMVSAGTYAAGAAVLFGVVIAATFPAARRATWVDPAQTLRAPR